MMLPPGIMQVSMLTTDQWRRGVFDSTAERCLRCSLRINDGEVSSTVRRRGVFNAHYGSNGGEVSSTVRRRGVFNAHYGSMAEMCLRQYGGEVSSMLTIDQWRRGVFDSTAEVFNAHYGSMAERCLRQYGGEVSSTMRRRGVFDAHYGSMAERRLRQYSGEVSSMLTTDQWRRGVFDAHYGSIAERCLRQYGGEVSSMLTPDQWRRGVFGCIRRVICYKLVPRRRGVFNDCCVSNG